MTDMPHGARGFVGLPRWRRTHETNAAVETAENMKVHVSIMSGAPSAYSTIILIPHHHYCCGTIHTVLLLLLYYSGGPGTLHNIITIDTVRTRGARRNTKHTLDKSTPCKLQETNSDFQSPTTGSGTVRWCNSRKSLASNHYVSGE